METEAAQRHDHGEAATLTEEMSPEVLTIVYSLNTHFKTDCVMSD